MPEAIVFDFDGVIVDSEPLHHRAFAVVGEPLGFTFTYEQYLAEYVGFDDRDAFRLMLRTLGEEPTPGRVAELCRAKQSAFEAVAEDTAAAGSIAVPGALGLIDAWADAGRPRAIASGATRADIDLMLRLLDRTQTFQVIVTADDVERSKPDPASYALATRRLGVPPEHCLAIEDTAAGLASATAAGLRTLGLTTTGPAEALHQAERIAPDLTRITPEQLDAWY
ncbi:MAG: HAD family phosphatase [Planctomycetota bacterium]